MIGRWIRPPVSEPVDTEVAGAPFPRCSRCQHGWHGLPCETKVAHCTCPRSPDVPE